ncbi:ComEC/Rec2 family competence protein [Nonomuraea rosea]
MAELAAQGASITAQIALTDDPKRRPGKRGPFPQDSYVIPATLKIVQSARSRQAVDVPITVFATGQTWGTLLPSQHLHVTGRLAEPNPGDLVAAILLVRGPPQVLTPPSGLQTVAGTLRSGLRTAAEALPPDQRGLLPGLVVGDVSRMDPQVSSDLKESGLSHLNAVSGANLAIVAGAALALSRLVGLSLSARAIFAALAMLAFAVVARPSPSVLRALLMGLAAAIALGTGRARDGLAALSATVLLLVLFAPELARSYGFALSVAATAGILLLAPRWRDKLSTSNDELDAPKTDTQERTEHPAERAGRPTEDTGHPAEGTRHSAEGTGHSVGGARQSVGGIGHLGGRIGQSAERTGHPTERAGHSVGRTEHPAHDQPRASPPAIGPTPTTHLQPANGTAPPAHSQSAAHSQPASRSQSTSRSQPTAQPDEPRGERGPADDEMHPHALRATERPQPPARKGPRRLSSLVDRRDTDSRASSDSRTQSRTRESRTGAANAASRSSRPYRLPRWMAEAVAVPAAAQFAVTPILVLMSGQVTPVALIANLLVAPAVAPATLLGFSAALIAPISPDVARLLVIPAGYAVGWIIMVAGWAVNLPFAIVPWPSGLAGVGLLALTLAVAIPILRRRAWRAIALTAAGAALVAVLVVRPIAAPWPPKGWLMVMCDVGQGDGLIIAAGPGRGVIVDTGPDPVVMDRCLRRVGVDDVPLLILTHPHADHVDGLPGILRNRRVGAVIVSPQRAGPRSGARTSATLARHRIPEGTASPGTRWRFGPSEVAVLAPDPAQADMNGQGEGSAINNSSVVLHVRWRSGSALLGGDLETEAQDALLHRLAVRADILKTPHHGSNRQSPAFLASLGARAALISVGADNGYGHPATSTLALLHRLGATVYRTDQSGDLAVVEREGRLAVVPLGR